MPSHVRRAARIRAALAWNGFAMALSGGGCNRGYVPATPYTASGPGIGIAPRYVTVSPLLGIEGVDIQTAAAPGTLLRGANLAPARSSPCATGLPFFLVEKDDAIEREGP